MRFDDGVERSLKAPNLRRDPLRAVFAVGEKVPRELRVCAPPEALYSVKKVSSTIYRV